MEHGGRENCISSGRLYNNFSSNRDIVRISYQPKCYIIPLPILIQNGECFFTSKVNLLNEATNNE